MPSTNDSRQTSSFRGLKRDDSSGLDWLDALAGRLSPRGLDREHFEHAVQWLTEVSGSSFAITKTESKSPFAEHIQSARIRSNDRIIVTACREMAVERAILSARRRGVPNQIRTVAIVGSDHGRTALCRTVSGQAELQLNYGPLVSGFAHLTADHEAAVEHRIDEQTVAVLISPIDMHDACRPLSSPFLKAIRQRCDDVGALLIADESLVPFGTTGHAITTSFIGDIDVDAAIFAHGLFGDADGACVVGGDWLETSDVLVAEHLVQQAFLAASCLSLAGLSPWDSYAAQHHTFAITLAEKLRDFSFVRDLHAVGGCIGIELDWPASELLQAAQSEYALLGRAGEHGVRLELPLHCSADDQELLLVRLMEACQRVQRQASTASS